MCGKGGRGVRESKKRFARGAKLTHTHTHTHTHTQKRGRNTLGFIFFFNRLQHGDDDSGTMRQVMGRRAGGDGGQDGVRSLIIQVSIRMRNEHSVLLPNTFIRWKSLIKSATTSSLKP